MEKQQAWQFGLFVTYFLTTSLKCNSGAQAQHSSGKRIATSTPSTETRQQKLRALPAASENLFGCDRCHSDSPAGLVSD